VGRALLILLAIFLVGVITNLIDASLGISFSEAGDVSILIHKVAYFVGGGIVGLLIKDISL